MIVQINCDSFSLDRIKGRVVAVYNPRTSKYSMAIATRRNKPTEANKAKAEETLGRLGSLFGEDE